MKVLLAMAGFSRAPLFDQSLVAEMIRIIACVMFAFYSLIASAHARVPLAPNSELLQFYLVQDPCGGGNASFCGPYLLAYGLIDPDAKGRLDAALRDASIKLKAQGFGSTNPPVRTIAFHSPGGSLIAGMEIGARIRELGINTVIGQPGGGAGYWEFSRPGINAVERVLFAKAECFSACAYAFMGGVSRTIDQGAAYGLHQFRGSPNEDMAQRAVVMLRRYLEQMGVNVQALDLASNTSANSMRILSVAEARRLRIDNSAGSVGRWSITATPAGEPLVSIEQELSDGRILGVRLRKRTNGAEIRVAQLLRGDYSSYSFNDSPSDDHGRIDLLVNGTSISTRKITGWSVSSRPAGGALFMIDVLLDSNGLAALAKAQRLELSSNFANAVRYLDPSTELGVDGLAVGIALLRNQR
jgi:hypothetical protein